MTAGDEHQILHNTENNFLFRRPPPPPSPSTHTPPLPRRIPGLSQKPHICIRSSSETYLVLLRQFSFVHPPVLSASLVGPRFKAEKAAGRVLFRGSFGTQKEGGPVANMLDVVPKNVANTGVLLWGSTLLALFEASQPYRLDPRTLETLGQDFLGGLLHPGVPFDVGNPLGNWLIGKWDKTLAQCQKP